MNKAALKRKLHLRRRELSGAESPDSTSERIRTSYNRTALFERDKGVCAHCKSDMDAVKRNFQAAANWIDKKIILADYGIPENRAHGDFWDGHHVVEVVAGCDCGDLSNIVTLCIRCHAQKSAELAGRKAKAIRRARKFNPAFRDREPKASEVL